MSDRVYLDHAAATPVDPNVLAAMLPYFTDRFYNPSAIYMAAENVHKDIESARSMVAQVLGVKQAEIIFTAGGTEANNLAISGVTRQFPGKKLVVSAVEHESVIAPALAAGARLAPVNGSGRVLVDELIDLIDDDTVLVSVMLANNEIGTVQPVRQISQRIERIRQERRKRGVDHPLYLHTDAAQAVNYIDVHISSLGVDLMTLNGGKIYGPKASGALYISNTVQMQPLILGGGQESGFRSGTENVPAIIGFATALEAAQKLRTTEVVRLKPLQGLFCKLLHERFPNSVINGSNTHRLPNNVHVTFPGKDNERILFGLDEAGIDAAAGSACSASSDEPSHVLKACGISDADAQASVRFTLGRTTTEEHVHKVVMALDTIVA